VQVFVGGVPLSSLIGYRDLTWTTRFPGGDYDASWTALVPQGWRHRAFVRGAAVQIRYGGLAVWSGTLAQFDRDTGQMSADGSIRRSEDYEALVWDGTAGELVATWSPETAVDDAISPAVASGRVAIGWTRDSSVPSANLIGATQSTDTMRLDALLELATARGYGSPMIGPDIVLRFVADPTTVSWHVRPKVVDVGEAAGDQRATRIYVDYMEASSLSWVDTASYSSGDIVTFNGDLWKRVSSGAGDIPEEGSPHWSQLEVEPWDPDTTSKTYPTGSYYTLQDGTFYQLVVGSGPDQTVSAPPASPWTNLGTLPTAETLIVEDTSITPYREERVNALALGDLPTSEATAIADQALAAALAPSFTTDIPATPLTATNAQMNPCDPVLVRAGTLVRVWGAAHPRLNQPFIDVIAGEVTVSDAETDQPTAVIKPFGKPAQSDEEVMEAVLNARREAG
jgi:hypothetical protein